MFPYIEDEKTIIFPNEYEEEYEEGEIKEIKEVLEENNSHFQNCLVCPKKGKFGINYQV